jgi:hypothetical protein
MKIPPEKSQEWAERELLEQKLFYIFRRFPSLLGEFAERLPMRVRVPLAVPVRVLLQAGESA